MDTVALYKDLEPLCGRRVAWRWDGLHYSKPVRSLGPELSELDQSGDVFLILVRHAKNGFPHIVDLRNVLLSLHSEFKFFESKENNDFDAYACAQKSADIWKTMLRHCVDIKKTAERQLS